MYCVALIVTLIDLILELSNQNGAVETTVTIVTMVT